MWSRWRYGWVIMTPGPVPDFTRASPGATDERQRKMVYTKRKTTGGPTCCCAA